jgi:hypothetical protein
MIENIALTFHEKNEELSIFATSFVERYIQKGDN